MKVIISFALSVFSLSAFAQTDFGLKRERFYTTSTPNATYHRDFYKLKGCVLLDEQIVECWHDNKLIHSRSSLTAEKVWNLPEIVSSPFLIYKNNAWHEVDVDTVSSGRDHYVIITKLDGSLLEERSLNSHFTDTTVAVKIFNPDPLTPYGLTYGGPFIDNSDAGGPVLDSLSILDSISVPFDSGLFQMKHAYATIRDFDAPYTPISNDASEWTGSRSEPAFEQVMCLFHLFKQGKYLDSLGFGNLFQDTLDVDPQAMNGQDNSMFNYGYNPPRLYFGEGGVDDAEDADVIIHEMGHALSHAAAPYTNTGSERRTYDEALGDFFAGRYSKRLGAESNRVFDWDGNNSFWDGRSLSYDGIKSYPNLTFNNIYAHTDLISSALLDLGALVVDSTGVSDSTLIDQLVLEQMHMLLPNQSLSSIAEDFFVVDGMLTNSSNTTALNNVFGAPRNIISAWGLDEAQEQFTPSLFITDGNFVLKAEAGNIVEVYSLNGQLLSTNTMNHTTMELNTYPSTIVLKVRNIEGKITTLLKP